MKKIYSIVLMATALLIGANGWAATKTVSSATEFENAWKEAKSGDVIKLSTDITIQKILWLGTATMDATPISLTIDLNGKVLENNAAVKHMFFITHGELNVISSVAGGKVIQSNWASSAQEMFRMTGSNLEDVDPKVATSGYFTHLTIGEGVFVEAQKQNALVVDAIKNGWALTASNAIAAGGGTVPTAAPYDTYGMSVYTGTAAMLSGSNGLANGVRVDIYGNVHGTKYAFKVNGNVRTPENAQYSPFVYLHRTSDLNVPATTENTKKPVAAYCSGYARWLIEGHCIGSTAVYVKAGEVDINDAVIESNYTGAFVPATAATGSGVVGCGSAIVIESNKAYSGDIDVEVSGDTKVSATNGYAVEEKVTNAPTTKVDNVTISGGTFEGGDVRTAAEVAANEPEKQGTIVISETTAASATDPSTETKIAVVGGMVDGAVTVGNTGNLNDIIPTTGENTSYATTVTDPETGKQTVVISKGSEPAIVSNTFEIGGFTSGDVNLSDDALVNKDQVFNGTATSNEIKIGTLMMNNPTNKVTLTIKSGKTISAEKVIMGYKAQIIVEPGAAFIVTGDQGITANAQDNIILQANATEQAIFLFNPNVNSNRHPNATVQMTANVGKISASTYKWHRFALPIEKIAAVSAFSRYPADAEHATYIYTWDYAKDDWASISAITDLTSFRGYTLSTEHNGADDMTYTFKGTLEGNVDKPLAFESAGYNFFGNSYSGSMSVAKLAAELLAQSKLEGSVWVWREASQRYEGIGLNALELWDDDELQIASTQTFILRQAIVGAMGSVEMDYSNAVWGNPLYASYTSSASAAPSRQVVDNNNASMRISISSANGKNDVVRFLENENNSDAFDNGYDVTKFINENTINAYATVNGENLGVVATDNLDGKFFNFTTNDEIAYTLSFSRVNGEEYAIRDNVTGAVIAIAEGATYEFAAQPNSTIEGRFEIISVAKVATAIENTEIKANVKGIYTMTGQYVGENFDVLPAGVYVVDGVKIVK